MVFIQLPDFGACFNHAGKSAKSVNGSANAMAKPNIPIAGPVMLPDVDTCTSRKPMIGPVHEKDTNARVKAIKKILNIPLVEEALLSTALPHLSGRRISNHPKNDKAKTMSNRQKKILNTALVESAFNELAPKAPVIAKPSVR